MATSSLDWLEAYGPNRASVKERQQALDGQLAARWQQPGAASAQPSANSGAGVATAAAWIWAATGRRRQRSMGRWRGWRGKGPRGCLPGGWMSR
jgi:hypothetical protein